MKKSTIKRKRNIYSAFGFLLESEIELPELVPGKGEPAARIIFGSVPIHLDQPDNKNPWVEMSSDEYILRVEGVAKFYVFMGETITIEAEQNTAEDIIRLFLLNSVLAVLLLQKSFIVFHGSSAVINGKAVLFLGNSGSGKSLIAYGLLIRNHTVISDEICAVKMIDDKLMVFPGIARINVWSQAVESDPETIKALVPVRADLMKYAVNIRDSHTFSTEPIEVGEMIVIKEQNGDSLTLNKISGIEKLNQLLKNSFFMKLQEISLGKKEHFRIISEIGNACILKVMLKNRDFLSPGQLVDFILAECGL